MRDENLGVLLERRHHGPGAGARLDDVERNEIVGANAEIDRMGGQQLRHIDARTALHDFDVETGFRVVAIGKRLIEAAMLGLRLPVGGEADAGEAAVVPAAAGTYRQDDDDSNRHRRRDGAQNQIPVHGGLPLKRAAARDRRRWYQQETGGATA